MTDIEQPYEDPILKLIHDPNLNRDKEKSNQLVSLINDFPLTERKISRLCSTTFSILQTLEKMNLIFKSWEFLSLDFSSGDHFNDDNDYKTKEFNYNIADKVINKCQELNIKSMKISIDIDHITKTSRTLSPIEYISDSGTLLTSLILRCIKLKNDIGSNVTTSYSKARLICIGKELELMLLQSDSDSKDTTTIESYKSFIVSLLRQLNEAIDTNDSESKFECLAVINDLEQMFEAYKLEKMKDSIIKQQQELRQKQLELPVNHSHHHHSNVQSDDDEYEYDDTYSEFGMNSMYSSTVSQPPMVHSITKTRDTDSTVGTISSPKHRRGSMSSMSSSTILHKTTISEELPYLMSAFNSAKTIEEDVSHFKAQAPEEPKKKKEEPKETTSTTKSKPFFSHKTNLPDSSLYSESTVLPQVQTSGMSPASYIYSNASLLSKLGIKPQVIKTNLTARELSNSTKGNTTPSVPSLIISNGDKEVDGDEKDKENRRNITPLTKANLATHTILRLSSPDTTIDEDVD
ncbi:hypothetical protein DFJ63DRAFT_28408 [Scheffersomyces coipomensis]|uniref:uncharacterized protein n=1 Tax=Scheffersomyces coipomensis TaxID=1788519 RepID=UPI00315C9921